MTISSDQSANTLSSGLAARARPGVVGGSVWVLAGRLVFGVSVLLQNIVFSRVLGPHELGAFLLAQSLVLPAAIFAVFGLDLLAVRELRDRRDGPNDISPAAFLLVASIIVAAAAASVAAAIAIGLSASCSMPDAGDSISEAALDCNFVFAIAPALWPLVFLSAMQLLLAGVLRALSRIAEATFLAGVLATFILLCATSGAFVWHIRLDIRDLLLLQVVSLAAGVALSLWAMLRLGQIRSGARLGFGAMLRVGPSLMTTQLLALLVSQSDVWVLGLGAPTDMVAQYGVAARLAQLVSLPHLVLNGVLPQLVAVYLSEGRLREVETVIRVSVAAAAIPSIVLGLAFAGFGRELLDIVFGPFFVTAAPVLTVLAIGNIVNVVCGPCSQVLIMSGHQKTLNVITAANCICCLGGGLMASYWLGAIGLAAVYAVGLSLQGIVAASFAARLVGVRTHAGPLLLLAAARSRLGSHHGAR